MRAEITMGDHGQITKLEAIKEDDTVVTIWNEIIPNALFPVPGFAGRVYRQNLSGEKDQDNNDCIKDVKQLRLTIIPTTWSDPKFNAQAYNWNYSEEHLYSGFDLYEIDAYEIVPPHIDPTQWNYAVCLNASPTKNNPAVFNIKNIINNPDYGLNPSLYKNSDGTPFFPATTWDFTKIVYTIKIGDSVNKNLAVKDINKYASLKITKGNSPEPQRKTNSLGDISFNAAEILNATSPYMLNVTTEEVYAAFSKGFAVRSDSASAIKVLPMEEVGVNDERSLPISNGRSVHNNASTGDIIDYYVPEYGAQPFYPREPYVFVGGEQAQYVDDYILKVRFLPLHVESDTDGNPTNLKVYNKNGDQLKVVNWNEYTGEITLSTSVNFTDVYYVDYTRIMSFYNYRGYSDQDKMKFFYLDLNPLPGHTYTYPLDNTGIERPSSELVDKSVYIYALPVFKRNTKSGEYSETFGSAIRHMIVDRITPENQVQFPIGAVVIGKVHVNRPLAAPTAIQVTDTRRLGGGFSDGISTKVLNTISQDSSSIWDSGVWDGDPFPSNSVIQVTVPASIIKQKEDPAKSEEENERMNIGKFTEQEIRDIINAHVAFGTYVFLEIDNSK
jgi:hypothetical protein